MKGKVILLSAALSGIFLVSGLAGPQLAVAIGGCAPRPSLCYRPAPVCYSSTPFFYGFSSFWGSNTFFGATAPRFSNVSPLLNYSGETPVVRVPPPVALTDAEPIMVSPIAPFTWKN